MTCQSGAITPKVGGVLTPQIHSGPCRSMAPSFAEAAHQLEPHYRLVKVNTEQEQNLAARFNIRSIPTLAIFRKGREVARQAGAMDTGSIVRWVKSHS